MNQSSGDRPDAARPRSDARAWVSRLMPWAAAAASISLVGPYGAAAALAVFLVARRCTSAGRAAMLGAVAALAAVAAAVAVAVVQAG